MTRRLTTMLTCVVGFLLLLCTGIGTPALAETGPEADTVPAADDTTAFTVDDAVFSWGINNESNNAAFAPGTFNFPSAGKAPNPGSGGQIIDNSGNWPTSGQKAWRASQGNVRIEKVNSQGQASLATLAGLKTGPDGEPLGGPTTAIFSSHQVRIEAGGGEIDPDAGTARVEWKGSFTVFYYSGMSFFSLSDPVLTVTPDSAKITATASGYGSSIADPTKWEKLPEQVVTIADLIGVDVDDLSHPLGFTADAAYRKVTYAASDGASQIRTGPDWGAFPTTFVQYVESAGSGAYWYSSGGSNDRFKVALPVTVSWSAKQPIEPPKPPPAPPSTKQPQPKNPPGVVPPAVQEPAQPLPQSIQPDGPALPVQPFDSRATQPALTTGLFTPVSGQPPVYYALTSTPSPRDRPNESSHAWEWALGILLLLGAAGIAMFNPLMHRLKGTR